MTYNIEFGTAFKLGLDLNHYPFLNDKSYKNDTSPSFWFKTQDGYFTLWIDYLNVRDRESDNLRYCIITSENDGDDEYPEINSSNGEIIFECESATDITHYLDNLTFT